MTTSIDHLSVNSETIPHLQNDTVQFSDHQLALRFQEPDYELQWGMNKYSRDFDMGVNEAIIDTESGVRYVVSNGVLMNTENGQAVLVNGLGEVRGMDLENIIIGRPWLMPGFEDGESTDVKSVMLRYKVGDNGSVAERFEEDPFEEYRERTREAYAGFLEQQSITEKAIADTALADTVTIETVSEHSPQGVAGVIEKALAARSAKAQRKEHLRNLTDVGHGFLVRAVNRSRRISHAVRSMFSRAKRG